MEHRDQTAPRRRRTKRRKETRERVFTWSGTDKSAAGRRRIRRDDDQTDVEDEGVESSDDESDDEDTSGSSSTIAPSPTPAPPPGPTTLSPPAPPPAPAPPVATPPSTTLDSPTLPPASLGTPTLDSGTVSTTGQPATTTSVAAAEAIDPPRTQNEASLSPQSNGMAPAATTVLAVLASLGGVSLLALLLWKLYRRRRGRRAPDQNSGKYFYGSGPGNGARAPPPPYGGSIPPANDPSRNETADHVSRWSDSTPGWLRRQVQKAKAATRHSTAAAGDEPSPKDAAVSGWMDRHTSRMLDPMVARASIASSGAASLRGLGPVPSVSPASVVGDPRESILSEMGQIRRAAVPPPLDPKMVERVRQMQGEKQMREQQQTRGGDVEQGVLPPPPPVADRLGNRSPTAMSPAQTETTWNTWGVEQRRK